MANSFNTAGNFPNESEFPQSQTVESLPPSVRIGANLLPLLFLHPPPPPHHPPANFTPPKFPLLTKIPIFNSPGKPRVDWRNSGDLSTIAAAALSAFKV